MDELLTLLQYRFNQRALLAAVLIGFLNGYFSGYVVLRRSSLFVGALGQSLLPGIAIGILLSGVSVIAIFFGALAAALFVALGALLIERSTRIDRDSGLAILYTTSFAAGLLLLERLPVNVEVDGILFGNILGLSDVDLWMVFGAATLVLPFLMISRRPLQLMLFQEDVARTMGVPVRILAPMLTVALVVTMVTSMQAVGIILSIGLLVTPGCIMLLFVRNTRSLLLGGGIIGAALSVSAILLANLFNIQPGATIILLLGASFLLSYLFRLLKNTRARTSSRT